MCEREERMRELDRIRDSDIQRQTDTENFVSASQILELLGLVVVSDAVASVSDCVFVNILQRLHQKFLSAFLEIYHGYKVTIRF